MKKYLLFLFGVAAFGQSPQNPTPLGVLRVYNVTSRTQYIDERPTNRRANYHAMCVTGSGTWSAQLEYSDTTNMGPWTAFAAPGIVTNGSSNCVGSALGYHPFIRINTTVGTTSATYTSWKDAFTSALGSGTGGGSIAVTSNVLRGDNTGNAISAGFLPTAVGIITLWSNCSGSQYLGADAQCHNAAGAGTVTSVQLSQTSDTNLVLTLTGTNPITTSGTINLALSWAGTLSAARMVNNGIFTGDCVTTFPNCTIGSSAITLAKMANLAAFSVIGNNTASPATPLALTAAQLAAMLSGQSLFTLTTLGTSGPATYSGGTLNIPQYGSGTGTGSAAAPVTVTFSTTPAFTCPSATTGTIVDFTLSTALSANISSSTLVSCTAGSQLNFSFVQAISGSPFTVAMPTGFSQACKVSPIISNPPVITNMSFWWDGIDAQLISCSASSGPSVNSEQAAPSGTPGAGSEWSWFDATGLFPRTKNSSGTFFQMAQELIAGNIRRAGGANTADSAASVSDISALEYATGGGSANSQTATYAPAITSLTVGLRVRWLPIAANTTTNPTFAPNGLATKTIVKTGGAALSLSDLTTTAIADAIYDGTNWELQNPQTITTTGGGVNANTTSYTLLSTDSGKLVTFNGSSLTATLNATPSSTYAVGIKNLNASALTISRNGLLINGGTNNITLQQYQETACFGDGTNYFCSAPDVAGTGISITPASNGETIAVNLPTTTCTGQFVSAIGATGSGTCSSITVGEIPNTNVLVSTTGAVADPGNSMDYQYNNASGALTFNAPVGVAGLQRCYRNATTRTGVITVQMATSNVLDYAGVNGTSAGFIASSGALGDAICIVSDVAKHWYAYVQSGTWVNH